MSTTITPVITITVDHVWAGSGKLINGEIRECGAQFCDDNDESDVIYSMIEDAIEAGKTSLKIEIDGKTQLVEWSICD